MGVPAGERTGVDTGRDREPAIRERLILALDRPGAKEAFALADAVGEDLLWVKVGLQLFTAEGPPVVRALKDRGKRVFLDLKLHDIPNTVAGAVRSAATMGADLVTLHAEGGPAMMRAAVDARGEDGPRLLAVTVLTSLDGTEYPDVYASGDVRARVLSFARAAGGCGVDGVVCSPRELASLGEVVAPGFLRVTPGIRFQGGDAQDQARVATPASAFADGATHLVVGRAVTAAPDPREAWARVMAAVPGPA